MLYVDQPAGTGFSIGRVVKNADESADDMLAFLQEFYKHDDLAKYKKNKLFITGQSYRDTISPQSRTG